MTICSRRLETHGQSSPYQYSFSCEKMPAERNVFLSDSIQGTFFWEKCLFFYQGLFDVWNPRDALWEKCLSVRFYWGMESKRRSLKEMSFCQILFTYGMQQLSFRDISLYQIPLTVSAVIYLSSSKEISCCHVTFDSTLSFHSNADCTYSTFIHLCITMSLIFHCRTLWPWHYQAVFLSCISSSLQMNIIMRLGHVNPLLLYTMPGDSVGKNTLSSTALAVSSYWKVYSCLGWSV